MFEDTVPLAERMRPKSLSEIIGQSHLVGVQGILRHTIVSGRIPSIIFWGPPGTGKTTLARILGNIYSSLGFLSEGGSLTFNAYYNGGWKYYTSGDAHILWGSGDGINLSMAGAGTANNAVSFSRAFQVTTDKSF